MHHYTRLQILILKSSLRLFPVCHPYVGTSELIWLSEIHVFPRTILQVLCSSRAKLSHERYNCGGGVVVMVAPF